MLTIAGGVILGGLGLLAIIAVMQVIDDNAEEIGVGCAVVVGLLAVVGVGAWLDSKWPEIDWIKTALALIGGCLAIFIAFGPLIDTPLVKRMRSRRTTVSLHSTKAVEPKRTMKEVYDDLAGSLTAEAKTNLRLHNGDLVFEKDKRRLVFYESFGGKFVVRCSDLLFLSESESTFLCQRDAVNFVRRQMITWSNK